MATRSEYRKNYRNYAEKATEAYVEHLRYRQLRRSAEFAHHGWAWAGIECEDTITPSASSAAPPPGPAARPTAPSDAAATGVPSDVYTAKLGRSQLEVPSKRLTKAPSLSTLSQSGSETDYEEREADLLADPLASVDARPAAAAETPPPDVSTEREKIRRAIREIKMKRQERQSRRRRSKSPTEGGAAATAAAIAADSSGDDFEEQLMAARQQRLRRKQKQQKKEEQRQQQEKQTRRQTDCPPLLLDTEEPQALHQQQPQPAAMSPPIFYPWGFGDRERDYGVKRTFNVRATRDVYDSALRARALRPPPPPPQSRRRPATAGAAAVAARAAEPAGGHRRGGRAATAGGATRDDYWLSEYAKNFAKYADNLYARNRQAMASRSRAADLL